jgi:hypothetical protein
MATKSATLAVLAGAVGLARLARLLNCHGHGWRERGTAGDEVGTGLGSVGGRV